MDMVEHPSGSSSPYPGLRSFQRSEFDIFFGRDDHVSEMLKKLAASGFLCVTGPSGCGKSSLARTGLFNALEAGFLDGCGSDWIYCDMHPETDPLNRLAAALAQAIVEGESGRGAPEPASSNIEAIEELESLFLNYIERRSSDLNGALDSVTLVASRPVVILIDQFEEIFRYAQDDPHEASRFVDVLLKTAAAKLGVYVVITIRTDELAKCSHYSGLTGAINQSQFLTPSLDRFQMKEAIEGPISLFNGTVTPELSIWLLNGLEEQLDKLPLMQHALRLLYIAARRRKPDGHISIGLSDFYRAFEINQNDHELKSLGHDALKTSLSHRLDSIYERLSPEDQKIARNLFCLLTTLESRGRDIRRPVKLGAATAAIECEFDQLVAVISVFKDGSESYLRIAGEHDGIDPGDTVDVAHECILRLWEHLQAKWLPEEQASAESIRFLGQLARERDEIAKGGTVDRLLGHGLLKGLTRRRHQEWWSTWCPNAEWATRYLEKLDWSDGSRQLDPGEMFTRVNAFVRNSASYAKKLRYTVGIASIVAMFGVAIGIYSRVQSEFNEAEERALRDALLTISPSQYSSTPVVVAQQSADVLKRTMSTKGNSGDLDHATSLVFDSLGYLYEHHRFGEADGSGKYAASYLGSGSKIVVLNERLDLSIWDSAENTKLSRVINIASKTSETSGRKGRSMAVSLDDTVAVGTQRGAVLLIEGLLAEGEQPKISELYPGPDEWQLSSVMALDFSPDGNILLAGTLIGHLHVWRRDENGGWSKIGSWRATDIQQHNGSGPLPQTQSAKLSESANRIWSVASSPDSELIAIGLGSGVVCLLTVDGTSTECSNKAHSEAVKALQFLERPDRLLSGGNGDAVRVWNLSARSNPENMAPADLPQIPELGLTAITLWQESDIWDMDLDASEDLLAVTTWDGSIKQYETSKFKPQEVLRGHTALTRTVEFAPNGSELLTASPDKTARTWTPFSRLADIALSHSMVGGSDRGVVSLVVGPDTDWAAYTDRRTIWVKGRDAASQEISAWADSASAPVMLVAPIDVPMFLVSQKGPTVQIWTQSEQGNWTERQIRLAGENVQALHNNRQIAVSADGKVFAVSTAGPNGQDILVCDASALVCGEGANNHIARVPFETEITTGRKADHICSLNAVEPTAIALSTTGSTLAVGGSDCNIRLFDLDAEGVVARTMQISEQHVGEINSLDFAPDGAFIAAASSDWRGSIWWLDSGKTVFLKEHKASVSAVHVLPSGRHVATVSNDERVIVSDVTTGDLVLKYFGITDSIHTLDVSRRGSTVFLAAGTKGGDVAVLRYFETPQSLLSFAEETLAEIEGKTE